MIGDTLQRKSAFALSSLCVSIKAIPTASSETRREGFYFLKSCLTAKWQHGTRKCPILAKWKITRAQGAKFPMEIKCSSCGFSSNGPDSLSGKKLKCPKCGAEFVAGCEFMVVEETPVATQDKKNIVEKPIGKIGSLKVTNKRVHGYINRKTTNGGAVRVEFVNIDVLLNLITGITVRRIENPARPICFIFAGLSALGAIIFSCVVSSPGPLVFGLAFVIVLVTCGINATDTVQLILSVSGVDHFIQYETSQMAEAEAKCKMLKDAKSEYERLACI